MKKILIIDFGSQYTQLIARRVREIGVYCEIASFNISADELNNINPAGIILSGGPESVTKRETPRAPERIFHMNCPVLGICYGLQTMVQQLGGEVIAGENRELGHADAHIINESKLFANIDAKIIVWMSHGDVVSKLPAGFESIATTADTKHAAIEDRVKNYYGLQFHPEVTHTKFGKEILENFVMSICACQRSWTTKNIIAHSIAKIKQQVGRDKVILGLSGGVDSSVVAMLLQQAIGEQLICVFVDTGLLRLDEVKQVTVTFEKHFGVNLHVIDAKNCFFTALKGVIDPEEKRKIIGREFVTVFQNEAQHIAGAKWLAQGTIYPDVIESAQTKYGKAQVIKSHHNVGGLPEELQLRLIEPLRELFKDEVRKIGLSLGLPITMVNRHPFPGPGLGIRILGEVLPARVALLQQVDAIFIAELIAANLYDQVSQAFATFLPIKTVAVVGDARRYDYIVALRAVETVDFMTAQWARLPVDFLAQVSKRILNEVSGISRVVYDISDKPPATIEWE